MQCYCRFKEGLILINKSDIIYVISQILRYTYYTSTYYRVINSYFISLLFIVACTISIYSKQYSVIRITILILILIVTSNIIYFYILMEVSIVYFIYLFIYRAYKERSRSLILIALYILIFRLPFIIIILSIATTRIAIMKVRNVSVSIGLLRV